MKKGTGPLLILLAALAVPSVLFYNWWAKQSEAQRAELQKKVKNRLPPGTPMFGSQPPQSKLDNPLEHAQAAPSSPAAPSTAAVAGVAPSTAAVAQSSPAQGSAPSPVPPAAAQAPAATNAAPGVPPIAPTATSAPGAPPVAEVSVDSTVALARDPMLSPYDMVRLDQMKLEEEMRRKEIASGGPAKRRVRHVVEHPVENDIDLQGIVSTDEGDKAIVNGEMVAEGELVKGAKIVKITAQAVVFMYKGRRFSKTISK